MLDDRRVERSVDPVPHGMPSPWRSYRNALELTPSWATHRLVLQDDTKPCAHFVEVAAAAVEAQPEKLVTFYVGGMPRMSANAVITACSRDESWVKLEGLTWCPAVALCWPVEFIPEFLHYVDLQNWPPRFRADDEIIGRWLRACHRIPLATVPSLVEHPDDVPSLIGRRAASGVDRSRVAACFIDPGCDARTIDWSIEPS